jgi:hypothetical protein
MINPAGRWDTAMAKDHEYRVFAQPVTRTTVTHDTSPIALAKDQEWTALTESIAGGTMGAAISTAVLILVSSVLAQQLRIEDEALRTYPVPIFLGFFVLFLAIAFLIIRWLRARKIHNGEEEEREKRNVNYTRSCQSQEQKYRRTVELRDGEAQTITDRLIGILKSSSELRAALGQHLTNARVLIRRAQTEYEENAYAPFWDAIQATANELSVFSNKARQLTKYADDYYGLLKGREHTFPFFPARIESLPDPLPLSRDFRRIVRTGQTNIDFAQIYELRSTRAVLIAGFQTLGEAVNNLGGVIEQSLLSLEGATSSNIARLVDEQIATRDTLGREMGKGSQIAKEQSQMLDNIQRHRKPAY